ncbi:MAG TPA: hypothetical protein VE957_06915 [Terriglobales bacterium]|nr:hypothetical protein [Terriglobales bacterium]
MIKRSEPPRLTRPIDKLQVIDDAIRNLDILKIDEERFILRDTQHQFGDDSVSTANIWLDREQMAALSDRIEQMLSGKVGKLSPRRTA